MNISKLIWSVRCLVYGIVAHISFPGYIGRPMYISRLSGLRIQKKVRIYPGLRVEICSKRAEVIIGENTSIGQNFHVVAYSRPLKIGKNVTISGNVFITNCDHSYKELDKHVLDQDVIENDTIIGDNCFIGYGSVILAGTRLGKQCIVGANSVVRGDYPDYCVIAGNPARIIRKYKKELNLWERV